MRLCISMIPHDRDSVTRKRTLVASSYRIVPRFIVGMQVQLVVGYVVLKPFADTRMAFLKFLEIPPDGKREARLCAARILDIVLFIALLKGLRQEEMKSCVESRPRRTFDS